MASEIPAAWTTRPMSEGHALSALQIGKHGRDRYPKVKDQAEKALAEVAELLGAISEHARTHHELPRNQLHTVGECPLVRMEYADAGLALYALGPKLGGLDLIDCMAALVDGDGRSFR